MISDEGMRNAANKMNDAADRAERAADRIERATLTLRSIFEDGYGGNALVLIELLSKELPR